MTAPGRSETKNSHAGPNYVGVFIVLAVLTAIEVSITYLGIPRLVLVLALLALAFAKAAFVALYFMHLKFDSRLLAAIFVIPLLLGSVLIYFLII
jgi:cytochrome c oxidase subunit 4